MPHSDLKRSRQLPVTSWNYKHIVFLDSVSSVTEPEPKDNSMKNILQEKREQIKKEPNLFLRASKSTIKTIIYKNTNPQEMVASLRYKRIFTAFGQTLILLEDPTVEGWGM